MENNGKQQFYATNADLVLRFLTGSRGFFGVGIAAACLVALTDLINPKIVEFTVDSVIGDAPFAGPAFVRSWIGRIGGIGYLRGHLGWIALTVVLVALFGALCRYLFQTFNARGSEGFVKRLRDALYDRVIRLPYAWQSGNHTGDLIQRCTSDVETIKVFVSEQMMSLFRVVLLIGLSMFFMVRIHWRLAVAEGCFIPVMVISSFIFYSRIGETFARVDAQEGRLSGIAQENLTGVRVVRAFGREAYERTRFEQQNEKYTGLWFRLMRTLASFWVTGNVVARVRNIVIILLGISFCLGGSLTAGGFIAFFSYNLMLASPMRSLGRVITEMSKAGISIGRIRYILNTAEEDGLDPAGDAEKLRFPDGDIVFDSVSFRYDGSEKEVLSDISFTVRKGATVGILGTTGSGKSTIIDLLDRVYDVSSGRILIGGADIRTIPRHLLRQNVGIVLQEPFLFSGTIAENIALGAAASGRTGDAGDLQNTDYSPAGDGTIPEGVREAAHIAALDETLAELTRGFDTFVGERGVTLSGGQRQRVAIAQTLYRGTPVIVMDDALSAVDAETDARIRAAMRDKLAGATVFLIAHRITTLMEADEIIVLENGRITQRGTHAELLKEDGLYRRVYELQTQEADV